jgi:hypothetical protein
MRTFFCLFLCELRVLRADEMALMREREGRRALRRRVRRTCSRTYALNDAARYSAGLTLGNYGGEGAAACILLYLADADKA